ncbi:MAG TPA: hypothetical protein VGM78_06725, partial [Ilumatobacteraceae bacterium]
MGRKPTFATEGVISRSLPFALTVVLAFALQPVSSGVAHRAMWAAGAAVLVVAALAITFAPWERMNRRIDIVPGLLMLVAIALLRQSSGGAASGYGALVLLPVVWFGLYGSRTQLTIMMAAATATLVVPLSVIGAPQYPRSGWRGAALTVAIGAVVGIASLRLRAEIAAKNAAAKFHESDLHGSLEAMAEPVGRYRVVHNVAGDAVDLQCVYLNRAGRSSLGVDVVGSLLSERLAAEGRSDKLAVWLSALTAAEPVRYDLVADEDNRRGVFEVQVLGMHDGVVTSWRDVTAERKTQHELQHT